MELLIVIVIIGILAALVIVAYHGIQQRANNAKTASVVKAYQKALIEYATEKGSYPIPIGPAACLGEGYVGSTCWNSGGGATENTTLNNNLRPYFGNGKMPLPNIKPIGNPGLIGAMFYSNNFLKLDGQLPPEFIWYNVEGAGAKCPVGPVVSGTYPNYLSTPPSSGYTNDIGGASTCAIALPDPTNL